MAKANKKIKTTAATPSASTSKSSAPAAGNPHVISAFHVLPLSIPSSSSSSTQHFVYLRPHKASSSASSSSSASLPSDRTLFLVNVPTDATEAHLRSLFDKAGVGRAEEVRFAGQQAANGGAEQAEMEAVIGIEEDEDDDGEAALADDDVGDMAATQAAPSSSRNKAGKKGSTSAVVGPPPLLPLPTPLTPRPLLTTGSTAHIVFLEPSSIQLALDLCSSSSGKPLLKWQDPHRETQRKAAKLHANEDEDEIARKRKRPTTAFEASLASTSSSSSALGLQLLLTTYDSHRPSSLSDVKKHADSVVARRVWITKRQRTQQGGGGSGSGVRIASYGPNGEPLDEDGFTVVVAGGKYGRSGTGGDGEGGPAAGSGGVKMARLRNAAKAKNGGGSAVPAGLEDFYRFQVREEARQRIARLRKGFAEDARRMGELKKEEGGAGGGGGKAGRRFRPY